MDLRYAQLRCGSQYAYGCEDQNENISNAFLKLYDATNFSGEALVNLYVLLTARSMLSFVSTLTLSVAGYIDTSVLVLCSNRVQTHKQQVVR